MAEPGIAMRWEKRYALIEVKATPIRTIRNVNSDVNATKSGTRASVRASTKVAWVLENKTSLSINKEYWEVKMTKRIPLAVAFACFFFVHFCFGKTNMDPVGTACGDDPPLQCLDELFKACGQPASIQCAQRKKHELSIRSKRWNACVKEDCDRPGADRSTCGVSKCKY